MQAAWMDSASADLTIPGSASALLRDARADVVINCAALADVDLCQRDPERAWQLNARAAGEIAAACRQHGAALVHMSTDAVFGDGPDPWTPDSVPRPLSVY